MLCHVFWSQAEYKIVCFIIIIIIIYVIFKLCALKVKGLKNFRAFAFSLKLRVNGGMLIFSITFITV